MATEGGGPARDQPLRQHRCTNHHRTQSRHAGQHAKPDCHSSDDRVQQRAAIDDQQQVTHQMNQRGNAQHDHGADSVRRTTVGEAVCCGRCSARQRRRGRPVPTRGVTRYRGVGPSGRRRGRAAGGAPGRTAIHRNPAGSRVDCGAALVTRPLQIAVVCGSDADGASSVPRHRGHQTRCRSRTFHRVPQPEHTWITASA